MKLKPLLAGIAVTSALASMPARAALSDALDSMFMTNATGAQAFQSQSRGGLVGGSLVMRAPIRNINLVTFDPPRWSAGCGGIDLFGGSFSFIDSDQLVALFRQVAANAVGLAFKAALNQINPSLSTAIQEFQSKVQSLNEMMSNTCAVANSVVKNISNPSAAKTEAENVLKAAGTAAGSFVDMMKATTTMFNQPEAARAAEDKARSGEIPEYANATWAAMWGSDAAKMFGNPSTGEVDENGNRELIMSLLGTTILVPKDKPGKRPDGQEGVATPQASINILSLRDLVRGGGRHQAPVWIYRCKDGYGPQECRDIKAEPLNYGGITGYVNRMLFGNQDGTFNRGDTTGIVGKISACNAGRGDSACGLTQAEKTFLETVSAPAFALLRGVQHEPGAMIQVAEQLKPIMINEIGVKFGEAVVGTARKAFYNSKYERPGTYDFAMSQMLDDLRELRQADGDRLAHLARIKESNAVLLGSNPALYVRKKAL